MRLIFIICLLFLASCAKEQDNRPVIVVSIEPIRYFTEAIADTQFQVVSMVPQGSSPESYDPTPRQLTTLADSKAFLGVGYIGYETSWHDRLKANAPQVPFFNLSEGMELIHAADHHHHHEGHHHHAGGVEPHTWTSPRGAMNIVARIADALCRIDSTRCPLYRHRTDSLLNHLQQIDKQLSGQFASDSVSRTFLIYHPSLSYLARDYGLQQLCIEEEGREPSAAHLKHLIEHCRCQGVRTIFIQPEFDRRHAEAIAKEIGGVEVVEINPLAYEWEEELMRVISVLVGTRHDASECVSELVF
ncbi:MAG: zinc ABC transporter substrate-binding protein [Bacteroides sp.]|nr:zinc ABC transporter substrate-binding protein [Bacteroides sp.]